MVNGTLPTRGERRKEGETREEVGNLDPRMNDPLYPEARVANLSRRALHPHLRPTCVRPFLSHDPPSFSHRGDDSTGIRSSRLSPIPLFPPFFTPSSLGSPLSSPTPVLPPFDHRHPPAILRLEHSVLSLSYSRRRLFLPPVLPTSVLILSTHSHSPHKLITRRATRATRALSLAYSRPSAARSSPLSFDE